MLARSLMRDHRRHRIVADFIQKAPSDISLTRFNKRENH